MNMKCEYFQVSCIYQARNYDFLLRNMVIVYTEEKADISGRNLGFLCSDFMT